MNPNKRMTGFIIHGFAVAHAAAAALLAQTLVGDEAVLTALTIAMIMSVARINGANWSMGETLAFLGVFIGTYVGTRGATFLVKWIPFAGNWINATVTFGTTEVLGWATYVFVTRGLSNPSDLSEKERDNLWKEAQGLSDTEGKESEKAYGKMSKEDKAHFDEIMRKLRNRDIADDERERYLNELANIAEKYSH